MASNIVFYVLCLLSIFSTVISSRVPSKPCSVSPLGEGKDDSDRVSGLILKGYARLSFVDFEGRRGMREWGTYHTGGRKFQHY